MSRGVAIRAAATVVLLRDGAAGLEALLLQRHAGHVFGANACVFPGGAVDRADAGTGLAARCISGVPTARASFDGEALAFWLAAIRECFEEAGVLVGCDGLAAPAGQREAEREALNAGTRGWAEVVQRLDLYFRLEALTYCAHWITPVGPPKRYSTRFFAARAPAGQPARCDGVETVAAWWLTPAKALARHRRDELNLMYPTRMTLERLIDYANVDAALAGLAHDARVRA